MRSGTKKRSIAWGAEAIAITALSIAAVIILNVAFTVLCYRFSLYGDMSSDLLYGISDECVEYLNKNVIPNIDDGEKINIVFCDDEDVISENEMQKYVYNSVRELCELFPDNITTEYLNIWEQPKRAREIGVTNSYDVAVIYGDDSYVISQSSMFVSDVSTSTVTAYHGEKRIASAMMRVTSKDNAKCYFTVNHGESVDSYELFYALADAGYTCDFIDILNFDIPSDCDLLLTVDPKQDMTVTTGVSGISEIEKLEDYIDRGGNYMVFVSPDTFVSGGHANLEALLYDFGADFPHKKGESGSEECYQIKDGAHSVSVDGYTIFGHVSDNAYAKEICDGVNDAVFASSTSINVSDKYTRDGDAYRYIDEGRERVYFPLISTYNTAEAYAGGRAVDRADDEPFTLMSVTKQTNGDKTSHVIVCAATSFLSENYVQSTVYGNGTVIDKLSVMMGQSNAPVSLRSKPFPTTEMQSITTREATCLTVVFTSFFALAAAVCGTVVLVRRKNAL